jgi:hypothetical protein
MISAETFRSTSTAGPVHALEFRTGVGEVSAREVDGLAENFSNS